MKSLGNVGPMFYVEISGIYFQKDHYQIVLKGGTRIAAIHLHAFATEDGSKRVSELVRGDKIWVDVPMFKADGSLWEQKGEKQ